MNTRIIGSLTLIVLIASFATANIRLPAIISDNMVIQANVKVPIWGWAELNETVTVTIDKQKQTAIADVGGKWMVKLSAMKPSDTPLEMTVTGKNTITVKNILVGQVWLGSGQSNMQMAVISVIDANTEIRNATYPAIRLFSVTRTTAFSPAADCNGRWVECSPQTVGDFSAVAYFFGRELYKELKQPVGLINSSWGGTIAETWMSAKSLRANPDFSSILQRHEDLIKKYPNGQADYDKALVQWQKDVNDTQKAGKPQPAKPATPFGPMNPNGASLLYNGMIAPVVPFALKGVIWYQGESNAGRAKQYQTLFPALITDWRTQWQQGDFAFYFVQLANYFTHQPNNRPSQLPSLGKPEASDWAELRQAQMMTLSLPNTGMAATMDIGDPYNIHPKNKQEVGRRLALWALAKNYGFKDLVYSGPLYKNMKIEKNKIRIYFDNVGSGLVSNGDQLKSFSIAGEDQKFVWANAAIDNNTVLVWSEEIDKPVAVRYGWAKWIECNLFNKEKLPAGPFRTDNWPGVTDNVK
ncbi:MAG: sialate O-acetylesterase [Sedimentisphaerales bacterium]